MKTNIVLSTIISIMLLISFRPVVSSVPEEISLMTIPKAALYWVVGDRFNTMDKQFGKFVATQVLHTNGTAATAISDSIRHIVNAVWRQVMAESLLPEANNFLPLLKDDASDNQITNYERVLATSVARPATIAGLAYDAGRSFLSVRDMYTAAMNMVQKFHEYEEANKKILVLGAPLNGTIVVTPSESASLLSSDTWGTIINTMTKEPILFSMAFMYVLAGVLVHITCQLSGPALKAIITNNNNQLWALNQEPWTRDVNTLMAFPMTVFAKPYVMSWLSIVRSTAASMVAPYISLAEDRAEVEQIYDAAYITGDKALFGYFGIKATCALISMITGALWARIHAQHAHAN